MAKKVAPSHLAWTPELLARFQAAGFLPSIVEELTQFGELYAVEDLLIVARLEPFKDGFEVVWMASLGKGLTKHVSTFLEGAKRRGASAIRFHLDEDEKALVRLLRSLHPQPVNEEGFQGLVYRVSLEEVA